MPDLPSPQHPSRSTALQVQVARENVVALLTHHFAAGTLSMEEFERRVGIVYSAGDEGALQQLVADLPAAANEPVPTEGRLTTILSHTARHGPMVVPRHLALRVFMGNLELDLRDATFAPGVSEIEVSATMGNVEITVPANVRVECTGSALLGSFESRLRDPNAAGSPSSGTIVRVTGRATLSSVNIHR